MIEVCRSCLRTNTSMHKITDTRYREMYELFTNIKIKIEEGDPETMCFVCVSQLRRFSKFIQMSQMADKALKSLLQLGMELTQSSLAMYRNGTEQFQVTRSELVSMMNNLEDESEVVVKMESVDSEEVKLMKKELEVPNEVTTNDKEIVIGNEADSSNDDSDVESLYDTYNNIQIDNHIGEGEKELKCNLDDKKMHIDDSEHSDSEDEVLRYEADIITEKDYQPEHGLLYDLARQSPYLGDEDLEINNMNCQRIDYYNGNEVIEKTIDLKTDRPTKGKDINEGNTDKNRVVETLMDLTDDWDSNVETINSDKELCEDNRKSPSILNNYETNSNISNVSDTNDDSKEIKVAQLLQEVRVHLVKMSDEDIRCAKSETRNVISEPYTYKYNCKHYSYQTNMRQKKNHGLYTCNICSHKFNSVTTYRNHLKNNCNKCQHCGRTFAHKSSLKAHISKAHIKKNFACPMCSKKLSSSDKLALHIKRHHEIKYTCGYCFKSFVSKGGPKGYCNHVRRKCRDLLTVPACDFEVYNEEKLRLVHTMKYANGMCQYSCEICDMRVDYNSILA